MKLISLNVGRPRTIVYNETSITTGIFKEPVADRVMLRKLNIDGDQQADLRVHGGVDKAVYGYPSEHYPFWQKLYPELSLSWGAFGENLTTEGMLEADLRIGDIFAIGASILQVTKPRTPCFKLAAKFKDDGILKRFMESRRPGFYFRVLQEGEIGAGDPIALMERDSTGPTISDKFLEYF